MAYIGKTPVIGNFQICDAIVVVDAQAAYTMQVDGVDVSPETANHMLVSLNGILQAPTSSFTVSGSTITFASALETGDVIDFIQILGNVLDLGVPSDNTVTTAKLADSSVTTAKLPDSSVTTAKLNDASVSLAKLTATGTKDATTFLRGDNTFAAAGGGKLEQIVISSAISSIGTTSTSFVNLSADLTVTITPTAASSSIFIMVFGSGSTGGAEAQYEINRSGTQVAYTGFAASNSGPIYIFGSDSPNTTSSVTYNVRAKNVGGAGGNTTYWSGNSPRKSWIIAMEIKA
jgi:hypothetical protein